MANYDRHELVSPAGLNLYRMVWDQARLRQGLEERWYLDTLQYYGYYDPDTEARLRKKKNASKLFVNMTRPKTKVLRARLIDLLFPTDQPNWDIMPTPVPRISRAMARMKDSADLPPLQQQETDRAQQEFKQAKEAAEHMRSLMSDQLVECRYVDVCRNAITQACKLGSGVVKGPFDFSKPNRSWRRKKDSSSWGITHSQNLQPEFAFVDLWDFFPDMDASNMEDCEFVFQMHRMSKTEVRRRTQRGEFDRTAARYLLQQGTEYYAPDSPGHFDENLKWVRQLENALDDTQSKRFIVFEYHGPLEWEAFESLCDYFKKPEWKKQFGERDDELRAADCTVWFSSDCILRFGVNPLESGEAPYSVFRLDPSETNLIGSHGVPHMLRDPQRALNAGWRLMIESAGLEGVPMFVIDQTRVKPQAGQDWEIAPGKVWLSTSGFSPQEGGDPIRAIKIGGELASLIEVVKVARTFMDDEANLPQIAQGEQGAGSRQTAHGMTLLANAVNVLFRDAARGFDADLTMPNMLRLYEWNMQYADDEAVKGDMEIKALGSSVLLIQELVSQNLLMMFNLMVGNPELFSVIRFEEMLKLWFNTLHLGNYKLIKPEEEILREQKEAAAEPPPPDPAGENKIRIEEMRLADAQEGRALQLDIEMMRLAQKQELTLEQISASLQKVRLQARNKERLTAAEMALKARHGTGI